MLLWAAEHYGVDATGITLSRNQHAHVNRLIEQRGLGGRVRMERLDYRKLDATTPFDKIASVGMFEHVGRLQLQEYFARLRTMLRRGTGHESRDNRGWGLQPATRQRDG